MLEIIITLFVGYIAWNEKDKVMINKKLNTVYTKDETERFVDLKTKPLEVLMKETSEDIKECNRKLEALIDKLIKT